MNKRTLTVASLNVRGLGRNSPKKKEIHSWISSLVSVPQILLLQEHHLVEIDYSNSTKGIQFSNGAFFWNYGLPMGHSQRMSTGTSILIDRPLAPLISANDIFLKGRAQFITLQIPSNGNLTIINVYAAYSSNEKASMWERLSEANLATNHFILGDDFNQWEEIEHGRVAQKCRMHKKEVAAWHHLTLQYSLMDAWKLDSFQKMFAKEFTFDNGRSSARSTVSRIDKFLVSQDLDLRGRRIEAATSIRKFSDHSPLVLSIWGQPAIPDKSYHYFDSSLLKYEKGKAKMLQAWEGELPKPSSDSKWAP
jgi:exonuclease III